MAAPLIFIRLSSRGMLMYLRNFFPVCLGLMGLSACVADSSAAVSLGDDSTSALGAEIAEAGQGEGGPTASGVGLDVNDVSLLLDSPVDRTDPSKVFTAATRVGGTELVPQALFNNVLSFLTSRKIKVYAFNDKREPGQAISVPGPRHNAIVPLSNGSFDNDPKQDLRERNRWTLLAVRLDGCAPHTLVTNKLCKPQIRLVLQPTPVPSGRNANAKSLVIDESLHLLFDLVDVNTASPASVLAAQTKLATIAQELKLAAAALGVTTSGKPLGRHPAFDSATAGPAFRSAVERVLLRELPQTTLAEIAFAGVKDGSDTWAFFSAIVRGGTLYPAAAFFNGVPVSHERRDANLVVSPTTPVSPQFSDGRPQAEDLYRANDPLVSEAKLADTVNLFNNPTLTAGLVSDQDNSKSITCVSCHIGTNTLSFLSNSSATFFNSLFSAPNRFDSASTGATNIVDPRSLVIDDRQNFRNFGYLGETPTVSIRTLHETALVVRSFNALLRLPASGRSCDEKAYLTCLASATANGKQACVAQACP